MEASLKIAICEDSADDAKLLEEVIAQTTKTTRCSVYASGEEFLSGFQRGDFDLIYLDIYMGRLTGMETAERIRQLDDAVVLAFTTTSRDHAFEANAYRSIMYIEKPVTRKDILHTLEVAHAMQLKRRSESLKVYVKDAGETTILLDDIMYVDVRDQQCIIHLPQHAEILISTAVNIDDMERQLTQARFYRTHRSYIVNFDHVDASNGTDFVMRDGSIVYITQREYRRIIKAFEGYLFDKARAAGL